MEKPNEGERGEERERSDGGRKGRERRGTQRGRISKLPSKVTSTLFLMTTVSLLSPLSVRPDTKPR